MKKTVEKNHVSDVSKATKNGSHSLGEAESEQRSNTTAQELPSTSSQADEPETAQQSANPPNPVSAMVHVAPNLMHLVTGLFTTEAEQQAAKEQRDLNEIVHQVLVVGLLVSTALMLIGLGLDLMSGRETPTTASSFRETFQRVLALRPSGFLTLGLLVLIATPILRVIGSIAAFAYERDWSYALITLLVLIVVIISLITGHG